MDRITCKNTVYTINNILLIIFFFINPHAYSRNFLHCWPLIQSSITELEKRWHYTFFKKITWLVAFQLVIQIFTPRVSLPKLEDRKEIFLYGENRTFAVFPSTLSLLCGQTAWDNLVFSSDSGCPIINLQISLVLLGSISSLTGWKIGKCKIILVSATVRYINYYINFKIEFLQKGSFKHFQTFSTHWHWPWAELPPSGMLGTFIFFKPYFKTGVMVKFQIWSNYLD